MTELVLPGGARVNMPSIDTQYILRELGSLRMLLDALLRLEMGFSAKEVVRDLGLRIAVQGPVYNKVLRGLSERIDQEVEAVNGDESDREEEPSTSPV